ncbi:hypothetical protein LEMLEM_LOCUS18306 [Lemmus lemmus]
MKELHDRRVVVCWGRLCLTGLWRRRLVEPGTVGLEEGLLSLPVVCASAPDSGLQFRDSVGYSPRRRDSYLRSEAGPVAFPYR